jgi:hypothetical protein
MKNYLLDWRKFETEFDGNTVSMDVKPLKRGAFLRLLPVLDMFQAAASNASDTQRVADFDTVMGAIGKFLPEYVKNITGFEVDGRPPTIQDIIDETPFARLCTDVIIELTRISTLSAQESKNSEGPSASPISG